MKNTLKTGMRENIIFKMSGGEMSLVVGVLKVITKHCKKRGKEAFIRNSDSGEYVVFTQESQEADHAGK